MTPSRYTSERAEMAASMAAFDERAAAIRRRARRSVAVAWAAVATLVILVWGTSYVGRSRLVDSQRNGCVRSTHDRLDFSGFIRSAEGARRAAGNTAIADSYARQAATIELRAGVSRGASSNDIDRLCTTRFPSAGIFGF